ncbi:MAG: FecR domain-containing protein [Spirochaetia bacterium]
MKRILFMCAILAAPAALTAQEATVVYIDGWVDIRDTSGRLAEAWEGDAVTSGESVITGEASFAELEKQNDAAIIRISPDTVFTLEEIAEESGKREVMRCALGSVEFKFNRLLGLEPRIATPSVVAGVRGTEFTVFAGVDGSTLIGVSSGEVEVTASGESVSLYPDEGVEVLPGSPPGEKFPLLRGSIDYSEWNAGRYESFQADPAAALKRLGAELDEHITKLDDLAPLYRKNKAELDRLREELKKLREKGRDDEAKDFYANIVAPIEKASFISINNIRYYSLGALSLRQYLLSPRYVDMKMRLISDSDDPDVLEFLDFYNELIERYSSKVSPWLVEADI